MPWIDVHTHLGMLKTDAEAVVQAALSESVERMMIIGTDPKDNPDVLALAKKLQPYVFCTLGIHPHEAKHYNDEVERDFESLLGEKEVVGIGEIGLDYYYDHSPRDVQIKAFRRQLDLAEKHDLPVEIHTREAEEDTIEILKEYKGRVRGLLHCFTGTQWCADEAIQLGWDISLSGVCTFKNADALRDVVVSLPIERIHVETDAPFMSPVPHRGKENQPAFVVHTARKVAELKQITEVELSQQLKKNALRLFPKLVW